MKNNRHMLVMGREIRGLTQQQLSKLSGVDQGAISKMENGEKSITDELLKKLADALSFPLAFFRRDYKPVPVVTIFCKHGMVKMDGRKLRVVK